MKALPEARSVGGESEIQSGERGYHGRFSAENELAKRGFLETGGAGGGEFVVGPSAFWTDSESDGGRRFCAIRRCQRIAERRRVAPLGEHQAEAGGLRGEGLRWLGKFDEMRNAEPAGLLGGFQENFLPALRTFGRCGEEALFAASCGQRNNFRGTEFGGFLDGPFEGVEFDDGE